MTPTWDPATLTVVLGQAVLLIVFLVRTANTAKSADKKAEEARDRADEAHEKVAALQGLLALHREQVAREYVDRDVLRDMETRLTNRINSLGDRIDESVDRALQRKS